MHADNRWSRTRWVIVITAMAGVGLLLGWLLVAVANMRDDIATDEAERAELKAQVEVNQTAAQALAQQVKRLGKKPVVNPNDLPEDLPEVQGISQDQVRLAVASYCTANPSLCRGPQGPAGRDGKDGTDGLDVTPSMVAAAVATYCDARGQCTGPSGSDGSDGKDGATGPQGPPPSDAQVATAVVAYCDAHDGCRGPQGPPGADGQNGRDGRDGRGITSLECDSITPLTFTVHWDDGTTDTFTCSQPPPEMP